MLAQILPGVRHLRTPLITGYLYFILAWMVLGAQHIVPEASSQNSWEQYLADLLQLIGRGGTAVAVTTAAYLVGSMLVITRLPIPQFAAWRAGDVLNINRTNQPVYLWSLDVSKELHRDLTYRLLLAQAGLADAFRDALRAWWDKNDGADYDHNKNLIGFLDFEHHVDDRAEKEAIAIALTAAVLAEFKLLSLRLQIERETLFNEYDRLRNEAELRFSISLPLVLLCFVAAIEWNWLAILALVIPLALVLQGTFTQNKAQTRVMEALVHGVVESPTVSLLRSLEPVAPPTESERSIETLSRARWTEVWRELRAIRRHQRSMGSSY